MPENKLLQFQPIHGADAGSFAHFTIQNRLPEILKRIMADSPLASETKYKLNALLDNILHGKIEFFPTTGPNIDLWAAYLQPHLGKSWFDAPFYFVEAYFYRMILDAVNYFNDLIDPFQHQKIGDIRGNLPAMVQLIAQFEKESFMGFRSNLGGLLRLSLWGNKSDLSQLKMDRKAHGSDETLIDDTEEIMDLISGGVSRVDIVLDNSGMELFTDLLLATYLISFQLVDQVVLHAKAYPTFVSDATREDVEVLLNMLEKNALLSTRKFVEAYKRFSRQQKIVLSSHGFWNSPLHFYEMPLDIYKEFSKSELIIFKGDANYRRVFGDRDIPYDVQPQILEAYLPSKCAAIRILKSEIITGITSKKSSLLTSQMGNEWLVSGRYGIIQLLN